jgi:hypothetical protein
MEISFPTLKRGANKHCAYGAAARRLLMQFSRAFKISKVSRSMERPSRFGQSNE